MERIGNKGNAVTGRIGEYVVRIEPIGDGKSKAVVKERQQKLLRINQNEISTLRILALQINLGETQLTGEASHSVRIEKEVPGDTKGTRKGFASEREVGETVASVKRKSTAINPGDIAKVVLASFEPIRGLDENDPAYIGALAGMTAAIDARWTKEKRREMIQLSESRSLH